MKNPDTYAFYTRIDKSKSPIAIVQAVRVARSRHQAAIYFSQIKQLPLKEFLKIYAISR